MAGCLKFSLHHRRASRKRERINLSELRAVLEVEESLAIRRMRNRYLLCSDSQVALAALVKGRSASPALNRLLRSSLANLLGSGLAGNYGYVPSLANVADDPTRGVAVRSPARGLPEWWDSACGGDFKVFDLWLQGLGYDPLQLAQLPFDQIAEPIVDKVVKDFLPKLRAVQKHERLLIFDAAQSLSQKDLAEREAVSHLSSIASVSPFEIPEIKKSSREQTKEPEGQTKTLKKSPKRTDEDEGPKLKAVVSTKRVAPPEVKVDRFPGDDDGTTGLTTDALKPKDELLTSSGWQEGARKVLFEGFQDDFEHPGLCRENPASELLDETAGARKVLFEGFQDDFEHPGFCRENPASELLNETALALLERFPGAQFIPPGGGKREKSFRPRRKGFLDLFSGKAGVAREIARQCNVWVLTFDYEHGAEQDLLQPELEQHLKQLVEARAFAGFGAAPECCSFSRAVVPPWRSRDEPAGFKDLYPRAQQKVHRGNLMAAFVLELVESSI